MKRPMTNLVKTLLVSALANCALVAVCWAGPPAPPTIQAGGNIPLTPVGGPEVSALTVAAVAAYGFWKMRK